MKLVFPNKTQAEINDITTKFYHHLCDMIVEAIKSLTISEKEMKEHFKFSNVEVLNKIEKMNKSTILMCAHYGSWEWIFILNRFVDQNTKGLYLQQRK